MRRAIASALACLLVAAPGPGRAFVAEQYDLEDYPFTRTWWDTRAVAPGTDPRAAFEAAIRADRDYIRGMRPHHAGALTMSEEYLRDPQGRSPVLRQLARAIIVNQEFEIGLLDEVSRLLDQPPRLVDLGFVRLAMRPEGTEGLGRRWRFLRESVPVPLAVTGEVTARDVRFAKAMMIHHNAALDMARGYQANAEARNGFLGLLNVHIITDQAQEIAIMRRIVAAYPGDAAAIQVQPSEIHGMEGHMGMHGMGGGAGNASPDAGAQDDHRHHGH